MTTERAAGLVVCRVKEGHIEYMLLKASYPPYHWSPPKGHVDPGEDEWTAALRETKEEAGYDATQLDIFKDCHQTLSYTVKSRAKPTEVVPKTVKYWLAKLKNPSDVALSNEHTECRWLELENAVSLGGFVDMGTLMRSFHKYAVVHAL